MIKVRGIKILFYSALAVGVATWGCASHDVQMGSLRLKTDDYKKLLEEQMVSSHAEKIALDKPPNMMTDVDHESRGDVHFRQGNLGRAFVQYDKALRLNPNKAQIRYKMGLLFLAKGLNREAIAEFQEVLKKEPDYALAHQGIGIAVFKSEQPEAAEKHFQQALKLEPKLWLAHTFLGIIYNHQNLPEAAVREHQMAIMLQPEKGALYNNLGISYILAGKYDDAVTAFERALKTGPSHKKIYNNLGLVLSKLGRYEEALEAFRLGGDEAQAYNNLGCMYLQQGEREKAIRSFEKAIELRPTFYAKASENLKKATNAVSSESSFDSKIHVEYDALLPVEETEKGEKTTEDRRQALDGKRKTQLNTGTSPPREHQVEQTSENTEPLHEIPLTQGNPSGSKVQEKTLHERPQSKQRFNIATDAAQLKGQGTPMMSLSVEKSEPDTKPVVSSSEAEIAEEIETEEVKERVVKPKRHESHSMESPEIGTYTVHLATFKERTKAHQYIEELRKQGLNAFEWEIYTPDMGKRHRLCIGNFTTFIHAQLLAKDLEQKGIKASVARLPGARNPSQSN